MPQHALPTPPEWKRELTTVGVTGTNGKTSTTRFVAAALGAVARPVASTTTVGSFLDETPFACEKTYDGFLEVLREARAQKGRFAAIEMTSEALARGFGRAWPCEVAVFTNLSHDHIDAHGTPEHYLASKAQLFVNLTEGGVAVINAADPNGRLLAEIVPAHARTLFYAAPGRGDLPADQRVDLRARAAKVTWAGTELELASEGAPPGTPLVLRTRGIGEIFGENLLAAFGGAIAAGVPPEAAAGALAAASPPPGRFEVVSEAPRVVVDYAHTPDALARTLATARALATGKVVVVFGAGGERDKNKRSPMGRAASLADRIFLTTDNPRKEDPVAIAESVRAGIDDEAKATTELDRRRAIELGLRELDGPGDVLVVAGRGHETEQHVLGKVLAFSDVAVVKELLAGRG